MFEYGITSRGADSYFKHIITMIRHSERAHSFVRTCALFNGDTRTQRPQYQVHLCRRELPLVLVWESFVWNSMYLLPKFIYVLIYSFYYFFICLFINLFTILSCSLGVRAVSYVRRFRIYIY